MTDSEEEWDETTAFEAAQASFQAAAETRTRINRAQTALTMAYVHLTRRDRPGTALAWVEKAAGHLGLDLGQDEGVDGA